MNLKIINKEKKGITLISLVIIMIVLAILASIVVYSGIDFINLSNVTKFTAEMEMMQAQLNTLYDKYKNGEKITIGLNEYLVEEIGKDISEVTEQVNKVFTTEENGGSGITDDTGYRYFDTETLQGLNIEGIEKEFFVNVSKRSVISYEGIEYEGKMCYTLKQLPSNLYNVEYEDTNTGSPTFSSQVKTISDDKWRITISNIEYSGYIEKWEVKYKLEGTDYWNISEDLSFVVNKGGKYLVKIQNGNIESETIEIDTGVE